MTALSWPAIVMTTTKRERSWFLAGMLVLGVALSGCQSLLSLDWRVLYA